MHYTYFFIFAGVVFGLLNGFSKLGFIFFFPDRVLKQSGSAGHARITYNLRHKAFSRRISVRYVLVGGIH